MAKTKTKPVTTKGLDPALYRAARIQALKEGMNIGPWLNDLIREKLLEVKKEDKVKR